MIDIEITTDDISLENFNTENHIPKLEFIALHPIMIVDVAWLNPMETFNFLQQGVIHNY